MIISFDPVELFPRDQKGKWQAQVKKFIDFFFFYFIL